MWTDIPPARAKAIIQKLAQALQVKLPAGWDTPSARSAKAPKPKIRAAKKGLKA
jgi:hypothetical protein